ncbi:MAG: 4Fe-4S binding protein [Coriobacteriales bacterium]|jgi:indolepyruvate ferredoxin oxidoreductase alpha subunit|nr:4Fe-4S binding protein [Coriobacteriales bacterium]
MSVELCMGNQAIALAALKAGVNVVSGYPGTPSSEVLETVSARNPGAVHVEWSTNEKVALEVGAGAAFAGARALVTMKQVGLNVASDALLSLPYLGVVGGLVLLVADDPGPISSQTEQDTRQFAAFAKVPLLDPSTPEEAFAMVEDAFELSERFGTPVIVRPTTRICHSSVPLETAFTYEAHAVSGFERGSRWVVFPRRAYEGHLEILERLPRVAGAFNTSAYNAIHGGRESADSSAHSNSGGGEGDARRDDTGGAAHIGIAAGGISYAYLMDALSSIPDAADVRVFKVGTPFPFPEARALEFLEGLDEVLIFEECEPFIERELLLVAGRHHLPILVRGKLTGDVNPAGESSVSLVREQVLAWLGQRGLPAAAAATATAAGATAATSTTAATTAAAPAPIPAAAGESRSQEPQPQLPARPPVLCAGCPHRASYYAVKKALRGRTAVYSADIGCYTLGNALPLDMVDTCVCMGAGFTVPQGMAWAEPEVLHLGFVGDSTFFASGLTGVANAVYNQTDVTLCVLDNSITAMTGSQPHPGTGLRMSSDATERDAANALKIPAVLKALGVEHVTEVNPFDFDTSVAAVRAAVDFKGVSALVFKAPCITVSKPAPQPEVDQSTCTRCKACIKAIGCPALVVREGEVRIDTTLCYGCGLCVRVCPFDAITASVPSTASATPATSTVPGASTPSATSTTSSPSDGTPSKASL